ncbi:hypothetical protein ATO10_13124 [Actibacterium atlanticum]|uniref:Immunity MXAN-0049 protein domain-containing protein n=1 Tax=Actibacterium atlanticum TaxID=1461693 RepID=A0A058ZJI1_9RHOB|nr:DUF1629 domain-containing protein [Actibacterium atlanticum]KCV81347.1 hypothetical protein ATO10_13124 [Actibacterium atlanticum]
MSSTKPTVWVSRIMMDSTLIKPFAADIVETDKDNAIEALRLNQLGFPLPSDRFPKEQYFTQRSKKAAKQPDIFSAGGFWCVSAAVADVMRQFDLGEGGLYPTKLFQFDRETPVEGTYFCLNFGVRQQHFIPDQSPGATVPFKAPPNSWKPQFVVNDYDIAVRAEALDGPDMWIDPYLWNAVFMSDPLVQALKAAKLTRRFNLRKCLIV